jgi:hypothetical protein
VVIVLLSLLRPIGNSAAPVIADAEPSVASVLQDAREAMRGGVRIDTIGLGFAQNDRLLATLAGESGGLYQSL